MLHPLIIFGTRPEAIKLAPVIAQCRRRADVRATVCSTGQHREMLKGILDYFDVHVDASLDVMSPGQSLAALAARVLVAVDQLLTRDSFDGVIVQGDTTTAFAAATAAFYRQIPVVHVEAGLRTGDLSAPWPEEMNRRCIGTFASLHCAPTQRAADVLLREGAPADTVHVTGNTVVDALLQTLARETQVDSPWPDKYASLGDRQMVLITCHRRESFGDGISQVCTAVLQLAQQFGDTQFVYPVHKNPAVDQPVRKLLGRQKNIHLIEPAAYPEFVWLMQRSHVILSDSGGVQEEAPSLKRPVVLMRETTERPEAVDAGAVILVGTDTNRITTAVSQLLTDPAAYNTMLTPQNPFGNGHAAERIVDLLQEMDQ